MATLPRLRTGVTPATLSEAAITRPRSFDAGINTSHAWTEHLERESISLSDDDGGAELQNESRPARVLYDFEGRSELNEVSISAGADIDVLREEVGEGWSLVRRNESIGLLPRSYYVFVSSFLNHNRSASSSTVKASKVQSSAIQPQTTGEWFRAIPSFTSSLLLGGKSLNRFSSFVTSGAEQWIQKGDAETKIEGMPSHVKQSSEESDVSLSGERELHITEGPRWVAKVPSYRVLVHSPSKRTSGIAGGYTVYSVTSIFSEAEEESRARSSISVPRRFSQFILLHTALSKQYACLALPPLPDKRYNGRFNDDFVEARRRDLERYLSRLVFHPVIRSSETLMFFLSCEDEKAMNDQFPQFASRPAVGSQFFANVYHPAFNLDSDDARETVVKFEKHLGAFDTGVSAMRDVMGTYRSSLSDFGRSKRLLAHQLQCWIKSLPFHPRDDRAANQDQEPEQSDLESRAGLLNDQGAWCWRPDCQDCLHLTKSVQTTSECLFNVASLHDNDARRTTLSTHELIKDLAHMSTSYAPIIQTHKSALLRYSGEALNHPDEDAVARCDTVLNTTMAEIDTFHDYKVSEISRIMKDHLEGEIAFHEQALLRLKAARRFYDEAGDSAPCRPSMYETRTASLAPASLPQPCPHVFDSTPIRPVSSAVMGGLELLAGGVNGLRR